MSYNATTNATIERRRATVQRALSRACTVTGDHLTASKLWYAAQYSARRSRPCPRTECSAC